MVKQELGLQEMVDRLNDMLVVDPVAVNALFNTRIMCNKAFGGHPAVQTAAYGGKGGPCCVGIIGIINGLFGADEDGWGHFAVEVDDGAITKFIVTREG